MVKVIISSEPLVPWHERHPSLRPPTPTGPVIETFCPFLRTRRQAYSPGAKLLQVLLAERPTRMESFASSGSARSTRSTRLRTGRARGRGSGARSSRASSAEPAEVESGPDIVATEL